MNVEKLPIIFGERLRNIRHERNLTAQEVADKIGVHRSTYSNYETQNKVSQIDTLFKLAIELNVSADYLLGLTDCSKPKREYLNLKDYLKHDNLSWDGYTLTNSDIETTNSFLTLLIAQKKEIENLKEKLSLETSNNNSNPNTYEKSYSDTKEPYPINSQTIHEHFSKPNNSKESNETDCSFCSSEEKERQRKQLELSLI